MSRRTYMYTTQRKLVNPGRHAMPWPMQADIVASGIDVNGCWAQHTFFGDDISSFSLDVDVNGSYSLVRFWNSQNPFVWIDFPELARLDACNMMELCGLGYAEIDGDSKAYGSNIAPNPDCTDPPTTTASVVAVRWDITKA